MKRLLCLLLALCMVLSLTACGGEQPESIQLFAMDTVMDLTAYGENAAAALTDASREINRLERLLSRTIDTSEISQINAGGAVTVSEETASLLAQAQTYTAATDRTKGAVEALAELGIEPAGPIRYGKWDEGWGRAATRLLLDQGVTFDAVVCQNDQLARGCIDVLKQQGLRIPDDVAVIGHDNWSVLTSSSRPALTSIDNETETIGRRAARYLVDAIDGNPHHGVDYVPCHLIQRESTLPLD